MASFDQFCQRVSKQMLIETTLGNEQTKERTEDGQAGILKAY